MSKVWNVQNTERTVPSTVEHKTLFENIVIQLNNKQLRVHIYDTPLGQRFLDALKDNLKNKRILEKNFCWLGWADSKRNLHYLVEELNKNIAQINSFAFDPPYENIHPFTVDDFQYSDKLPIGYMIDNDPMKTPGLRLKHDACNLLHRYFEDLQGTAWQLSNYYKQADYKTKYAIRQLNNLCHEIESWVHAYRKSKIEPEWMRCSQITTFLNAPRYDLHEEDYELFKQNRYDRELGGVYLHWSQVGKTLYEVWRDEDAPEMDETTCSEINHQKYYSGEFDIEWGQTITEKDRFKKEEMDDYRSWLSENGFDWNDPKLSLGYIKIGQVDMKLAFGSKSFLEIYKDMSSNLNISSINVIGLRSWEDEYPYTLDSEDWKQIQIDYLKKGYESRNLR
jgi:hypothetical protein